MVCSHHWLLQKSALMMVLSEVDNVAGRVWKHDIVQSTEEGMHWWRALQCLLWQLSAVRMDQVGGWNKIHVINGNDCSDNLSWSDPFQNLSGVIQEFLWCFSIFAIFLSLKYSCCSAPMVGDVANASPIMLISESKQTFTIQFYFTFLFLTQILIVLKYTGTLPIWQCCCIWWRLVYFRVVNFTLSLWTTALLCKE